MSMPMRKMSSAMKRLMHRFLWMVFLSLWRPRKKQNVKMLMARQMMDTTIPTRLMTLNKSSWTLSAPWQTNTFSRSDNYIFTFMHLADAFIQSDWQCDQCVVVSHPVWTNIRHQTYSYIFSWIRLIFVQTRCDTTTILFVYTERHLHNVECAFKPITVGGADQ